MSDKLDSIIKEALAGFEKEAKRASSQCPSDAELAQYLTCVISEEPAEEGLREHISGCDYCFTRTASALSCLMSFDKDRPQQYDSGVIQKIKSIPKVYPKPGRGYLKRNRYLFIAGVFFILSFMIKGYFLQFLVAASVLGLKWVMDTGGSKALIMVYDAWQHRRGPKDEERGSEEKRPLIKNRRI